MRDRVHISHRGTTFEIGCGRDFYGIWAVNGPRSHPIQQWPLSPEGWHAAWARFVEIERPDRILAVVDGAAARTRAESGHGPSSRSDATVAASMLACGVALGVGGLFPDYLGGASLAQQPAQLVPHVIYLALWAGAAAMVLLGGTAARVGAMVAAGASGMTFGFYFVDAGTAIASGSHVMGAGLVLALAGWLVAAGGSVVAIMRLLPGGTAARPRRREIRLALPVAIAALGTAIAFAPSWDSYTLTTAAGQTTTVTAGNAFANPGPVIVGNVAVMAALVAIAVVAALWRPVVLGAALLSAAIVPMLAQVVSALVQLGEATPSTEFGISSAQAAQIQLHITSGLTAAFYVYCALLGVLIVFTANMLFTLQPRAAQLGAVHDLT